ncbi:MAG TPA: BamA/TamA family outer membrane protein [Daejeonella sp.]|nr:BamA/TamA family outer membrane protein [Daejeonella sp.]
MSRLFNYGFLILTALLFNACSATKYVPQDDQLYLGAHVKVEDKNIKKKEQKTLQEDLNEQVRPKPNSTFLGIPYRLLIYNMRSKSGKGIGSWLSRKFGQAPVLFSTVRVEYNINLITNYLENNGYFKASASADSIIKNRKAKVNYFAFAGPQYVISSVKFISDSSSIGKAVSALAPSTILKVGDAYNLEVIKAERERIDGQLKEQGFYYFNPDYLIIQVDSTNKKHKVDLYVNIKKTTPPKAKQSYTINNIYIYPNYKLRDTTTLSLQNAQPYDDFYIVDPKKTFRPYVFKRAIFFHKNDLYNRTDHNLSLNRLVNLGTFKFVKNLFEDADSLGKPQLNAYYYLTPYPKKSIRAEITGKTNSANFTGSEFSISWRNRNAFKGAELLTVSAYIGTDVQISTVNKGYNKLFRMGTEANLIYPRFITPFRVNSTSAYVPRTKITLGYDVLNRQNSYILNSFRTSLGYVWKENIRKEHQLSIISFNYVQPYKVTDAYREQELNNPTLAKAIAKQFTIGPIYNFNFTNTNETHRTNTIYFNLNADLSGNIIGLLSGANIRKGKTRSIFGANYSQYIRLESDFRHYLKLGPNSQLASRFIAGYGYAYGNSLALPYVKQFFIGGTNSLRAFRVRSLGPGTFRDPNIDTKLFAADQSGDIKLEFNTEYRPKLFSIVRGALFIDAGNIWLLNAPLDGSQPGAKFSKDFLNEIAVGTGFGLRFDLSYLILRTDLAFPIRKPWLPAGNRWVIDQIDFGSKSWRKNNLVLNLAIGYPF